MSVTETPGCIWRRAARNERGVALISALSALLLLTPLAMALLSVGTLEFLISRNLVDATQALYVAEAGVEWSFNLLVNTPDWNSVASGPAGLLVVPDDLLPRGRATVSVRRATRAGDLAVTSTGTVNRAQRTVQAIVRRDAAATGGSGSLALANGAFDRHAVVNWREQP